MNGVSVYEPIREGLTLREAINRLFEDSFVPTATPAAQVRGMALDVQETPDAFIIKANLPGADKEKVDIHFQGDTLTLKATIANGEAAENSRYVLRERFHGQVARSLTLPVPVDADKANADFNHGVLVLTLPKSEAVKPRTIKLN